MQIPVCRVDEQWIAILVADPGPAAFDHAVIDRHSGREHVENLRSVNCRVPPENTVVDNRYTISGIVQDTATVIVCGVAVEGHVVDRGRTIVVEDRATFNSGVFLENDVRQRGRTVVVVDAAALAGCVLSEDHVDKHGRGGNVVVHATAPVAVVAAKDQVCQRGRAAGIVA